MRPSGAKITRPSCSAPTTASETCRARSDSTRACSARGVGDGAAPRPGGRRRRRRARSPPRTRAGDPTPSAALPASQPSVRATSGTPLARDRRERRWRRRAGARSESALQQTEVKSSGSSTSPSWRIASVVTASVSGTATASSAPAARAGAAVPEIGDLHHREHDREREHERTRVASPTAMASAIAHGATNPNSASALRCGDGEVSEISPDSRAPASVSRGAVITYPSAAAARDP